MLASEIADNQRAVAHGPVALAERCGIRVVLWRTALPAVLVDGAIMWSGDAREAPSLYALIAAALLTRTGAPWSAADAWAMASRLMAGAE